MKKHTQNTALRHGNHPSTSLSIRRETVRTLNPEDLALVAAGSSTVITERPPTTTTMGPC